MRDHASRKSIADLRPGDHICALHREPTERLRALAVFIQQGFDRHDAVLYFTDGGADEATQSLEQSGVDVADAIAGGRLVLVAGEDPLMREDGFSEDGLLARVEAELKRADDSSTRRVALDLCRIRRQRAEPKNSIAMERKLSVLLRDNNGVGFCAFDRCGCDAATVVGVLKAHPLVQVGRELLDNPYFVPAEELASEDDDRTLDRWLHHLEEHGGMLESLREGNQRYHQLFESLISGYALHEMIYDDRGNAVDYRFVEVNPAFEQMTGRSAAEVLGRTVREVWPEVEPQWIADYGRVVETGEPISIKRFSVPLGRHYEVAAFRPEPGKFAAVFNDVTDRENTDAEQRKLAERTYESQKLESLGVLAGGIAHDFNNLLVGILGNASLALTDLSPNHPAAECMRDVEVAAQRAAGLAKQLLAYSGRGRFVVECVDLGKLVEEMGHLLEASVPKSISIRYHFDESAPVTVDVSQLRQLVMNLVLNASQAIGEKSGIITIAVSTMECDASYLDSSHGLGNLPGGRYVFLEVSDTGAGMDAKTQAKMFDPFFTTKPDSRGLGLSAVSGIMRSHNGAVRVYSEVGRGTTIKLLFPASEEPVQATRKPPSAADAWRGTGTILVVDDEEAIRQFARRSLKRLGFDVLTAEDGREGLAIYRAHKDIIQLVLLDMMMPHMGGEQTFTELRRVDPDVKVILSSGYNEQDAVRRFAGRGLAGFIQKPYRLQSLIASVRAALEPEN